MLDVTLVSLALGSFLFIGQPFITLNSRVVYPIYLVAIGASALRFDPRICAVTGIVAMGEYLAVVAYTVAFRPLLPMAPGALAYGQFEWSDQISRLMLLAIAGIVSTSLVLRTRRLQWLSARDRLTDVINRSVFEDLLATEASRVRRADGSIAVLLVDVDRFGAFKRPVWTGGRRSHAPAGSGGDSSGDPAPRPRGALRRRRVRRDDRRAPIRRRRGAGRGHPPRGVHSAGAPVADERARAADGQHRDRVPAAGWAGWP